MTSSAPNMRDKSSAKSNAGLSFLTSGFRPRRRRQGPACSQKLSVDFVAARARQSLWSRDVPERRDNLARFQRELFKMTFASSNPPDPGSQSGLKRVWRGAGPAALRGTGRDMEVKGT